MDPAIIRLVVHEPQDIVIDDKREYGMFRIGSLNNHPSFFCSSTRAPAYLHDQLECPLVRPEVREMHHAVCVKNSNQVDTVKVEAFGHHLSAPQNAGLPALKLFQDGFIPSLGARGIEVHSLSGGLREIELKFFFQLFRSIAQGLD